MSTLSTPTRIGIVGCNLYEGISKNIFNNRPVVFTEASMIRYASSKGSLATIIPPNTNNALLNNLKDNFDGIILHGGVDISPKMYNEKRMWEPFGVPPFPK